ncbi:MAG: asparagine synthase (glutamine-hydrolyzing) [Rhodoferax sp. RIFCSPLOWO2_12_FULL_60_11]|nr:MAG: asparagine synthase (glutamine-hydrolyzing) [Rhodoferax sp. RIFCSPLOWO2_12_FULL_60_11]
MCGIHGIYRFDGQGVAPALLSAMGNVTRHRGPDDEGMHIDGPCGIAMRRLSIIDLAGGHQPLSNVDETLWLVCNGEIYNYRELRSELQAKGYHFKTGSDSEVLLHLYEAEGDDFVLRLNGMFDFALWDVRRHRLLIGRDRVGVKPLYVMQDGQRLAFATEAKALLTLPGVSAELNRSAVASYLHLGYVAAPDCIFKGIRKLPPATLLAVENGQVREWRYWRLSPGMNQDLSEREWIERVRAQLDASVRMQMVSDVPIGAFLSGGVDSSAVVGFMAKHSQQPIRTYAIGFSGGEAEALYNELPYARRVAKLFGTQHREIVVRPDVVSLLPKLLWHMDEPLSDTAFITTFLVSEFARQDVKVILSGVGGDELFGGYRRYLGDHYAQQYRRLPGWLRRSAASIAGRLPVDRHSGLLNTLRLAKGFLSSAEMGADDRYRSYLQVLDREAVSALLMQPDAAQTDPLELAFAGAGHEDPLNRMFAVDAQTQLPDDLLMLTDKMSMAVSLECRVPLLDHQLVELAASMPAAIKVRGGHLKHVLKEALSDLLPADILERKKRGFGTPMGAWLKNELAPLLGRLLAPDVIQRRGLFRQPVIDRLVADHQANRIDGTDALLALLNLEIWSRIYLDHRDPTDVAVELKGYAS